MEMVARTYMIRQIEKSDRLDYDRRVESAEARGDREEVAIIKEAFARWEREQGHEEEKLVKAVEGRLQLNADELATLDLHSLEHLGVEEATTSRIAGWP